LSGATTLAEKADITDVVGVTDLDSASDIAEFITYAKNGRVWDREPA
jgi:hypothetical protein